MPIAGWFSAENRLHAARMPNASSGRLLSSVIPETVLVFVTPPSAKELERRLVGRGTETPEVIEKRLSRASEESEGIEAYDYIVVNDDLEECVKQLHSIVMNAHYAPNRCTKFIKEIREELKEFSKGAN